MPLLVSRVLDTDASTSISSTTLADDPSGSPDRPSVNPAIPALIAVVVFVVCTLVVLKGVRALRGHGVVPVYRKPEPEEEKPRMWEVHMDQPPSSCVHVGERGWNGVMPISLEYLPPHEPPCTPPDSSSPTRPPLRPPARASRSLSRDSPRSSWSTFPEKRTASPHSVGAVEDPARLRVAVLIAMPSPAKTTPSGAVPAAPAPAYLGLAEV
ncbi:hypothetical protein TRAPUB_9856 [Trametes pubescens]|uniref:Uncharacterized protein n=1 Tax=Trametes pubescens TaxID=154538 RepID=A0A1M2W160_TRAPU|nr:hypothetical protein TRAPUB_9856 [Trametes pubescens]